MLGRAEVVARHWPSTTFVCARRLNNAPAVHYIRPRRAIPHRWLPWTDRRARACETQLSCLKPTSEQHAEQHGRSLRLAAILTAVAGAAHAILFVLSFWLVSDIPRSSASDQAIIDYYDSGSQRLVSIVGLYIMPFSAIAFMWFTVSLRAWAAGAQRRENVLLANMQLVSGIVYITLVLIGSAAISVTATAAQFTDGPIDPDLARLFPGYGRTVIAVLGLRIAAVFVVTTSNIGRSAGILPKWFVLRRLRHRDLYAVKRIAHAIPHARVPALAVAAQHDPADRGAADFPHRNPR